MRMFQAVLHPLVIISGSIGVIYLILHFVKRRALKDTIVHRQLELKSQRERLRKHLTIIEGGQDVLINEKRKAILSLKLVRLLTDMRLGKLKPVEVVRAYMAQGLEAADRTNNVCHFIEEAETLAVDLEKCPLGERGPLYGLPVALSENVRVQGCGLTEGRPSLLGKPSSKDGITVKLLKELGAIPFCLTNVPEAMELGIGCKNPIFGLTTHPFCASRTVGGSTGGLACLLALNGCMLGVGADIFGDLQLSAHCSGVVGLRPTTGRIPKTGQRLPPYVHGWSIVGLMSKDVDGVVLALKSIIQRNVSSLDPLVLPIPWNEDILRTGRKLKIGWIESIGLFESTPGCKRAVHEAVDLLRSDGHWTYPIKNENFVQAAWLAADLTVTDNNFWSTFWSHWMLDDYSLYRKLPKWIRSQTFSRLVERTSPITAEHWRRGSDEAKDLLVALNNIQDLKRKILWEWSQKELDVIIAPAFSCPAPKLKHVDKIPYISSSLTVFSALDLPTGSVPIINETKADQEKLVKYPSRSSGPPENLKYILRDCADGAEGLPLSVQVVGRPFQEEEVVNVMTILERLRDLDSRFSPMAS